MTYWSVFVSLLPLLTTHSCGLEFPVTDFLGELNPYFLHRSWEEFEPFSMSSSSPVLDTFYLESLHFLDSQLVSEMKQNNMTSGTISHSWLKLQPWHDRPGGFFSFFFPLILPCWVWLNIFSLWFILVPLPHMGAFTIHLSLKSTYKQKTSGCRWPKECQTVLWLCSSSTPTRDISQMALGVIIDSNTKDWSRYHPTWDKGASSSWSKTSCHLL